MKKENLKKISKQYYNNQNRNIGINTSMFTEDLSRYIIKDGFECKLNPSNKYLEDVLINLFPSYHNSYGNTDFKNSIKEAIQDIVSQLVYNGIVVLELYSTIDNQEKPLYKLTELEGIKIKIRNNFIEQVLKNEAGENEVINIPKNKCVVIEFPDKLGGSKKYKQFLSKYQYLDNMDPMNIFSNKIYNTPNYNVSEHRKIYDIELWRKSKPYSWHHRSNLGYNKLFSGYYSQYRTLKFMKTRVILRDYIIQELNKIIIFISKKLQIKEVSSIEIDGMITLDKINHVLDDYKNGKIGWKTISDLSMKI